MRLPSPVPSIGQFASVSDRQAARVYAEFRRLIDMSVLLPNLKSLQQPGSMRQSNNLMQACSIAVLLLLDQTFRLGRS